MNIWVPSFSKALLETLEKNFSKQREKKKVHDLWVDSKGRLKFIEDTLDELGYEKTYKK